jgi:phenylpropionate dioxygenase-like ring-hydroxylating dioxygenase large terminal subunit
MSEAPHPTHPEHTALPIPNGWFAVAFSRDLLPGEVKRIAYFGKELVLFRTRSGVPKVLDAYCVHLGAHLAEGGRVMGETIRCPFHGWQYDGNGVVTHIPYCKRIPPAARVRSWPVVERNHMIMVWHHDEGKPPSWDVPSLHELEDPNWTEPRTFQLEVPVHMQDMAENNCDPVHFQYVHGMLDVPESEVSYADGGRFMLMRSTSEQDTPMGTFQVTLEREAWGLGLVAVRSIGIGDAGLLMFSSTSPVHAKLTHSRWLFTTTRNLADVAGEEWIANMQQGVMQDMRIWTNKIHRADPVLCEADEYLGHFRRWARQFYSSPAGREQ